MSCLLLNPRRLQLLPYSRFPGEFSKLLGYRFSLLFPAPGNLSFFSLPSRKDREIGCSSSFCPSLVLGLQFWIFRTGVGTEASSPAFFLWQIQRLGFSTAGSPPPVSLLNVVVPAIKSHRCIRQGMSTCLGPSPPRDLFRGTSVLRTLDGPRCHFWVSKGDACGSRKYWEINFSTVIFHVGIGKIWSTQGKVLPWRDDHLVIMHGHVLVLYMGCN